MAPLSGESFALHLTIGRCTHEKLRYAQALLSHTIPSGDLAQVLDRVLELAIGQLEKRKFAATDQPRSGPRRSTTVKQSRTRAAIAERNTAVEQPAAAEPDAAQEARAASDRDVLAALRTLGFRADESRRAAGFSESLAAGPLEQRVRLALSYLRPKVRSYIPSVSSAAHAP